MSNLTVINFNESSIECHICGAESIYEQSVPMYEDIVLNNDYKGEWEWGGIGCCKPCYWLQCLLDQPMTLSVFKQIRGVHEVEEYRGGDMREPRDLPNIDGFEFIGITNDGEKICRVVQDPETTFHYVDGEAKYCELISWRPLEKPNRGLM